MTFSESPAISIASPWHAASFLSATHVGSGAASEQCTSEKSDRLQSQSPSLALRLVLSFSITPTQTRADDQQLSLGSDFAKPASDKVTARLRSPMRAEGRASAEDSGGSSLDMTIY